MSVILNNINIFHINTVTGLKHIAQPSCAFVLLWKGYYVFFVEVLKRSEAALHLISPTPRFKRSDRKSDDNSVIVHSELCHTIWSQTTSNELFWSLNMSDYQICKIWCEYLLCSSWGWAITACWGLECVYSMSPVVMKCIQKACQ